MDRISSFSERPRALAALSVAGATWGLTLPLSAIALRSVAPAWLVSLRFGCAALLLGLLAGRGSIRAALRPRIVSWGVFGYGAVVLLQCVAIQSTSVSHAAILGGIVPAVVVVLAIARGARRPSAVVSVGLFGAIGGVTLIAGSGGHATLGGDALVLAASICSGLYIFSQPPLLAGRNPVAVTAVQMGGASLAALPIALLSESAPHVGGDSREMLALLALIVVGSLLPFTLYAWSQTRVPREVSGAFLNLEALVGGVIGVIAFHDPMGATQALGMALMLGGILLVAARAPQLDVEHMQSDPPSNRVSQLPVPVRA